MHDLPPAEELNYWKTSQSGAETWIDKAERLIEDYGGVVVARATGMEHGREAIMLRFRFGADTFQAIWPVLPSEDRDRPAARRQAATMLYHEVKARAVRFRIFGARQAFFEWLQLPDGRTAMMVDAAELAESIPRLLPAASDRGGSR